nr:LPS export ABC transporter periplasmic protein LptC [Escherichia coli]
MAKKTIPPRWSSTTMIPPIKASIRTRSSITRRGTKLSIDCQHVEYYSDQAVSWFTQPVLTTFDKDKIPTWSVKADKAKLTNDRMLYLYGHVEVNALVPDSQLRRITTDNAQINLVTQDVTSEDLVTLYGTTFNSAV